MSKKFPLIVASLILLLVCGSLSAQMPKFEQLSLEQGLSESIVLSILQDHEGFIWVGTEDGLNRYDGYNFKIFNHNSQDAGSLSTNMISAIYEDHQGTVWIGTLGGGLNKFDRKTQTFTAYRHEANNANSLSSDLVNSIWGDANGILWLATLDGGLNRLDPRTGNVKSYQTDSLPKNSLSSNRIFSLAGDQNGILWLCTVDAGLNRFDPATETFTVMHEQGSEDNPANYNLTAIFIDRNNLVWYGSVGGGLIKFDQHTNQFTHYRNNPADSNSLSNNHIMSIIVDQNNLVWVGTFGSGLACLDQSNHSFTTYAAAPTIANRLQNNNIRAIYQDRTGIIWLGTYGSGINRIDPNGKKFITYRHDLNNKNSLRSSNIRSIYQDRSGILWVGTMSEGLNRYDEKTDTFSAYRHEADNPFSIGDNIILSIFEDNQNSLWVGTVSNGLNRFDRKSGKFTSFTHNADDPYSISSNVIYQIYQDREDRLWIATYNGGLSRYDKATNHFINYRHDAANPASLNNDKVVQIYQDHLGQLWVATDAGGLNLFDPVKETFISYQHDKNNPQSISSNRLCAVYEDHQGTLWIGTYGDGLNRFDRDKQSFTVYTQKDGLANDVVMGILEDKAGNLWLSTDRGISKFNPATGQFRNYDVIDGLQSNEFYLGAYFQNPQGEMFFGGANGVTRFYPEQIKDNEYLPPITLAMYQILDQSAERSYRFICQTTRNISEVTPEIPQIQLSYQDNRLYFEFAALNFSQSEKNRYAYRLEGFDQAWIYSNTRRNASYTNLDPGSYTFHVKASNNDSKWNEAYVSIKLTIVPPPWRTWWAYSLYFLGILSMGYGVARLRVRVLQRRNLELSEIIQQQTAEVTHQRDEITKQRDEIQNINSNILDSIHYAEQIQRAMLPFQERINQTGIELFTIYQPKDIVSGDFYWFQEIAQVVVVVVADCTGHGVPGAFMSMLGNSLLNQIVIENRITDPVTILTQLQSGVRAALKQSERNSSSVDGMDVAICQIDLQRSKLIFAGAKRPLYYVDYTNNNELIEIKGDRRGIGGKQKDLAPSFSQHEIEIKSGLTCYLTTDGFADQPDLERTKFGTKQLKALLQKLSYYSLTEQHQRLIKALSQHSGDEPQRDDITILGIKITNKIADKITD